MQENGFAIKGIVVTTKEHQNGRGKQPSKSTHGITCHLNPIYLFLDMTFIKLFGTNKIRVFSCRFLLMFCFQKYSYIYMHIHIYIGALRSGQPNFNSNPIRSQLDDGDPKSMLNWMCDPIGEKKGFVSPHSTRIFQKKKKR